MNAVARHRYLVALLALATLLLLTGAWLAH